MADFDAMKDEVVGKVKETTGKILNNEELEAKGKARRLKGEAEAKAKDTVDGAKEKTADKFNDLVDKHED